MSEIISDCNLFRELGINSIKAIELVVAIQEKFDIQMDDSNVEKMGGDG